jgi:hypothetical protein
MGIIKIIIELSIVLAAIAQVTSWLLLFLLNHTQSKIQDQMRAKVTQPEYYLIKWEDNPKWAKIEKVNGYIIPTILITGIFLLIVGFIYNAINGEGSCYSRFEDYCSPYE